MAARAEKRDLDWEGVKPGGLPKGFFRPIVIKNRYDPNLEDDLADYVGEDG